MVEQLQAKREQIVAACLRHGVARLDVFGSAVRSDFRPGESDFDFLVTLGPMELRARVDAYFDLHDELESILGTKVDLVMVDAVKNPYFAEAIESTKQNLYAA